ncbi:MAG: GNAT family N-acetyltransferase [Paenisporosarcina sp.]
MIQFVNLDEEFLPQMAELLSLRHIAERAKYPFLPERFENPEETENLLRTEIGKPYVNGLVALRNGKVIGYLLYEFKEDAQKGRHILISYPSIAIDVTEHPRLVRLMYAEAGAEWIKHGYFQHIVYAPLGNERQLNEWLEQGFRFDQKYAVLNMHPYEVKNKERVNIQVRKSDKTDEELLKKMSRWNSIHQAAAPSWNPITKETLEDVKSGYASLAADAEAIVFLGEEKGMPAGFHVYFDAESKNSMFTPENCVELKAASTNPGLRGRGIGKALTDFSVSKLMEMGYHYCLADWHTPNHLSSYFWPKMGYQPFMVRIIRTVDNRIAWAHGK